MRIDAYTHFIPRRFFDKLRGQRPSRYRQARARNSLHPRSRRAPEDRRSVQGLCADPLLSDAAAGAAGQGRRAGRGIRQARQRRLRRDLREISATSSPAGWRRAPLDRARCRRRAKTTRAIKNGALGVQIYTNVAGKPLDDPEFEPFFAAMEQARQADLAASVARRQFPGLSQREEIEIRNLVDLRLVLRDRGGDVAAGVLRASWTNTRS